MTAEAIVLALRHAGWSLAEYGTTLGHVAEAHRDGHRISVAARTPGIARPAVWAELTGPNRTVATAPSGG